MIIFDEEKQNRTIMELRLKEEEDLAQIISKKYQIPYLDLSTTPINSDALRLVSEEDARAANIAIFKMVGKKLHVAVSSPAKKEVTIITKELETKGYEIFLYIVSKHGLKRVWERYKELSFAKESQAGILEISEKQVDDAAQELQTLDDVAALIKKTLTSNEKYKTSRLLEIFIAGSLATKASDIHIEPEEKDIVLRFRIDGVLQILLNFEHSVYKLIASRIKLISGMKINVKQVAQDGRFSIKFGGTDVEVRTSIIPGAYGESIVMRLLNPNDISVSIGELGMEPELFKVMEHEIKKPNGMILNTGPTGSGKTTTLYALLKKIKTPQIKIITIENPIEYHLPGIVQTQVNYEKKYTFASGLRAGLRQDPDIIMVGEIRDEETAKTAVNAALTGHLVLSTLHTNNAGGTIPRLIDLKINPKIISSALTIALAQRLVRRLCKNCKIETEPNPEEREIIEKILKSIKRKEKYKLKTFWKTGKCSKCNNTGYKGRIGIFEAVIMDAAVEKATVNNPSEREIWKATENQGILNMKQDGVLKILQGITSLEELQRVVDTEEEFGNSKAVEGESPPPPIGVVDTDSEKEDKV